MTEIEDKVYTTFSNITESLGYSDVHGRIIAALLVNEKPLSLQRLAKETRYSPSTISLSLDLLELFGMINKIKRRGDRKLYVRLDGDLLEGLKKAIFLRVQQKIRDSLKDYENYEKELQDMKDGERVNKIIKTLKKEMLRIEEYTKRLSNVPLPE